MFKIHADSALVMAALLPEHPASPPPAAIVHPTSAQVATLRHAFETAQAQFKKPASLVFKNIRSSNASSPLGTLDPIAKKNKPFLAYQHAIMALKTSLEAIQTIHHPPAAEAKATFLQDIAKESRHLERIQTVEWESQTKSSTQRSSRTTKRPKTIRTGKLAFTIVHLRLDLTDRAAPSDERVLWYTENPVYLAVSLLVSILHLVYNVAVAPCNFVLRAIHLILRLVSLPSPPRIPLDLRTALKHCVLSPVSTTYVCCPQCCCLYPEEGGTYPDLCTEEDVGEICGARLTRIKKTKGGPIRKPIRRFTYRHLGPWLAELLCRPGMETLVDNQTIHRGSPMKDMKDGLFAQEFRGADGELFVGRLGNLSVGLGIDWFHPFGMRVARKKRSIGAIYAAVQDLPISIRHRPENICIIGIIPGPSEPLKTLGHVNPFLRPLVDELLELWDPGVHLSSTPAHSAGRRIRVALGQIIADLQACRAVGGFVAESHTIFCSFCHLHTQQAINFFRPSWGRRSHEEHLKRCTEWRDAPTREARKKLEEEYGVRWTELLRLPYWRSSRQTAIDMMHALYRLIEVHCRDLWGMDAAQKDDLGEGLKIGFKIPNQSSLATAEEVLLTKPISKLRALRYPQVQALAYSLGFYIGRSHQQLVADLERWVRPTFPFKTVLLTIPPQRIDNNIVDENGALIPPTTANLLPATIDVTEGERCLMVLKSSFKRICRLRLPLLQEMCRRRNLMVDQGARKAELAASLLRWVGFPLHTFWARD